MSSRRISPAERGMTLVEMLVVLAIIAITASVSVLALGGDSNLRGIAEAKRIEARLQLAADQTMIDGRPRALSIAPGEYRFLQLDLTTGEWVPLADRALSEPFELPSDMQLLGEAAQSLYPLGADGSGQPFELHLDWDDRRWNIAFDGVTARMAQATSDTVPQ